MSSDDRGLRRFDGEGEDPGKSLKKWRTWAQAKMLTLKDVKAEQRGPWLFTLLDGKAWDAREHVTLEELATDKGEKLLWDILQRRFPEKEAHDLMGEALGEVFALAANDSETMKQWTSNSEKFSIAVSDVPTFDSLRLLKAGLHCTVQGSQRNRKPSSKRRLRGTSSMTTLLLPFVHVFQCTEPHR